VQKSLSLALILLAFALPLFSQQNSNQGSRAGYLELQQKIEQAEQKMDPQYRLLPEDVAALDALAAQISATYFQDLIIRSRLLLVLSKQKLLLQDSSEAGVVFSERLVFVEQMLRRESEQLRRSRMFDLSLGTGIVSFGLSYTLWLLSEWADHSWTAAATLEEAVRWGAWSTVFAWGSYITGAVSLVGFGFSIPLAVDISAAPWPEHHPNLPVGDD
jgi:hypothetical protein